MARASLISVLRELFRLGELPSSADASPPPRAVRKADRQLVVQMLAFAALMVLGAVVLLAFVLLADG